MLTLLATMLVTPLRPAEILFGKTVPGIGAGFELLLAG